MTRDSLLRTEIINIHIIMVHFEQCTAKGGGGGGGGGEEVRGTVLLSNNSNNANNNSMAK